MKKLVLFLVVIVFNEFVIPQTLTTDNSISKNEVVVASDVKWGWLNPLHGDKSPAAGQLWGDRTDTLASGFLVKFKKGFSSPPHIHNVTYRGVVIKGLLHNDDENAKKQWLPTGSFWQQPAGEVHITAALGEDNLAYIEIQKGPYLVKPTTDAFDSEERPLNLDTSNLVWLNPEDISWVSSNSNVETAFLWGTLEDGQLRASLLKLPANFKGELKNLSTNFRVVVISGGVTHQFSKTGIKHQLEPGSYFGLKENASIHLNTTIDTIIYIRSNGDFKVK